MPDDAVLRGGGDGMSGVVQVLGPGSAISFPQIFNSELRVLRVRRDYVYSITRVVLNSYNPVVKFPDFPIHCFTSDLFRGIIMTISPIHLHPRIVLGTE